MKRPLPRCRRWETTAESGDDEVILDIRSMEEHDDKPLVVEGREIRISPSSSWPPPLVTCRKEDLPALLRSWRDEQTAGALPEKKGFANVKVYRP